MLFEASELRDVQAERAAVQRELLELRAEALRVTAGLAALRAETARLAAEKLALEEDLLASGGVSDAASAAMLAELDGERHALAEQVRLRVRETAEERAPREVPPMRFPAVRLRETVSERVAREEWETKHVFGFAMQRELRIPALQDEPKAPDFHATELPPLYP
jgi:hypothetical protein